MKTFISDLIPKLQKYSQRLDNLTLLTNQHWVVIDEIKDSKYVYIFRSNNELLISQNGIVEKAKWEYIGNNSLLIDRIEESYLFKQGFFDENILALKVDSKNEYAFLINENKYNGDLNSIDHIIAFLKRKYIQPNSIKNIQGLTGIEINQSKIPIEQGNVLKTHQTNKGILEIEQPYSSSVLIKPGRRAFMKGMPAPDGKYKLDFMTFIHIRKGAIDRISLF